MKIKLSITFILLILTMLTISCAGLTGKYEPEPTAIIVDAETGEPIEGAVAMAVCWKDYMPIKNNKPDPIVTVMSDNKGRIYIENFWDWHVFKADYPELSVYKCGYICWNQLVIKGKGDRHDFDKKNRVVRLEKWPENFSFIKHYDFISSFVRQHTLGHGCLLVKTHYDCEVQKRIEEREKGEKK